MKIEHGACRLWSISVFLYDDGTRGKNEFSLAVGKAKNAMKDEVRAIDVMEPRLDGEIPISVFGHQVREHGRFSVVAACNQEGHSHVRGLLMLTNPEDSRADSVLAKVYEAARRAFESEGFSTT